MTGQETDLESRGLIVGFEGQLGKCGRAPARQFTSLNESLRAAYQAVSPAKDVGCHRSSGGRHRRLGPLKAASPTSLIASSVWSMWGLQTAIPIRAPHRLSIGLSDLSRVCASKQPSPCVRALRQSLAT